MAIMGYDGIEAVNALNAAIEDNAELKDLFDKANREVFDAFNANGGVVGGLLGSVCAKVWGDGSADFFQHELMRKTNAFLMEKVLPIINSADQLHHDTTLAYDTTLQQAKER